MFENLGYILCCCFFRNYCDFLIFILIFHIENIINSKFLSKTLRLFYKKNTKQIFLYLNFRLTHKFDQTKHEKIFFPNKKKSYTLATLCLGFCFFMVIDFNFNFKKITSLKNPENNN